MMRKLLFCLSIIAGSVFVANAAVVATGTVMGNVTSTTGTLIMEVAGAVVTLTPTAGGTTYLDTTSGTGAYNFPVVPAGTYDIYAAATGYTTSTPVQITVTAADTTTANIALTRIPGVTVSGTVTDSTTGGVVVGALVLLENGNTGAVVESTTTVAGGAYTLTGVADGIYQLHLTDSKYEPFTSAEFRVAELGVVRNIALIPLPMISGTVTNVTTGGVVVGAMVRLENSTTGAVVESTTTIAGGAYDLDNVQEGTYVLNVSAAGYITTTTGAFPVVTSDLIENVQLPPKTAGVTISGTVTNATTGGVVVGALVRLRAGATTAVVESTITVAGGAYTLDSVQAGDYNLNVTAIGYATGTVPEFVVAAANLVKNVALTPLPTVTVSGYITDSSTGAVIVGATVLLKSGTTVVDSTMSIAGGAYTLTGVTAGTYNLVVSATDYATKTVAGLVVGEVNITGENVRLRESGSSVIPVAGTGSLAKPDFNITATGVLHLVNFTRAGLITMFSVDGKLAYRRTFDAQENSVTLPHGIVHSGSAYIVSISQGKSIYRKQVTLY
jgi:hypothetical protein